MVFPRSCAQRRGTWPLAGACLALCLLASAALPGCSSPNYDPPTLVKTMRVLAVKAEPPYIGLGPSTFSAFVVNQPADDTLCYAWAVCLFAWENNGNYECLDPKLQLDLGNGETASTSLPALLGLLENLQPVLAEKGFNPPTNVEGPDGATDSATDAPEASEGLSVKLLFQVSEARIWGGSCPNDTTTMLAKPCPTADGCLMGHKALGVAVPSEDGTPSKAVHSNPTLLQVALNGVPWPADTTPTLAPYVADPNAPIETANDLKGVELQPLWAPGSRELIAKSVDPGVPDRTERLIFSFFSNAGTFDFRRTGDAVPENGYQAKRPADGAATGLVKLWIVVRDGRGGVDWLARTLNVDVNANPTDHPLCGADPSVPKCGEVSP